jgi:hypothetical protein
VCAFLRNYSITHRKTHGIKNYCVRYETFFRYFDVFADCPIAKTSASLKFSGFLATRPTHKSNTFKIHIPLPGRNTFDDFSDILMFD